MQVCPERQGVWPEAVGPGPLPRARAVRSRADMRRCTPPVLFVEGLEIKTQDPEPTTDSNVVCFVESVRMNFVFRLTH